METVADKTGKTWKLLKLDIWMNGEDGRVLRICKRSGKMGCVGFKLNQENWDYIKRLKVHRNHYHTLSRLLPPPAFIHLHHQFHIISITTCIHFTCIPPPAFQYHQHHLLLPTSSCSSRPPQYQAFHNNTNQAAVLTSQSPFYPPTAARTRTCSPYNTTFICSTRQCHSTSPPAVYLGFLNWFWICVLIIIAMNSSS